MRATGTLLAALLAGLPAVAAAQEPSFEAEVVAERAETIRGLLEELPAASRERREAIVWALGELRAAEAAEALVSDLARLHRGLESPPSPLRNPGAPDHARARARVDALRKIGRPGLDPFLETLATWPGYALDITFAFVAVHGDEGILLLRERARTDPDAERRRRLEAAAWFARLRQPGQ